MTKQEKLSNVVNLILKEIKEEYKRLNIITKERIEVRFNEIRLKYFKRL